MSPGIGISQPTRLPLPRTNFFCRCRAALKFRVQVRCGLSSRLVVAPPRSGVFARRYPFSCAPPPETREPQPLSENIMDHTQPRTPHRLVPPLHPPHPFLTPDDTTCPNPNLNFPQGPPKTRAKHPPPANSHQNPPRAGPAAEPPPHRPCQPQRAQPAPPRAQGSPTCRPAPAWGTQASSRPSVGGSRTSSSTTPPKTARPRASMAPRTRSTHESVQRSQFREIVLSE